MNSESWPFYFHEKLPFHLLFYLPIDPLYCDDSCHANISCTITFFTKEDFKDCLVKYNQPINVPTEIVKTPDRSVFKTSTTTKIYPRYTTVNPLITSTKQSIWTKEPDIGIRYDIWIQ